MRPTRRAQKKKPEKRRVDEAGGAISADLAGAGGEAARRDADAGDAATTSSSAFPAGATSCHKCNTAAVIVMDGCETCLNCGYSKCG